MIEALNNEEIVRKAGGRFRLAALIQRRWAQLMEGARPLVDRRGRTDLEVVIDEIAQGKIALENVEPPKPAAPATRSSPPPTGAAAKLR